MMMDLYDQDRILEIHIASEKKIAAEEEKKKAEKEALEKEEADIWRLLKLGKLSVEEIADCKAVSVQRVREIEADMFQKA